MIFGGSAAKPLIGIVGEKNDIRSPTLGVRFKTALSTGGTAATWLSVVLGKGVTRMCSYNNAIQSRRAMDLISQES